MRLRRIRRVELSAVPMLLCMISVLIYLRGAGGFGYLDSSSLRRSGGGRPLPLTRGWVGGAQRQSSCVAGRRRSSSATRRNSSRKQAKQGRGGGGTGG
ncbi:unnamed protein product, partial [Pylaiella littoralis]